MKRDQINATDSSFSQAVFFSQFSFLILKMETKMDQLRTLVETADKDKVELLNQLEEERR